MYGVEQEKSEITSNTYLLLSYRKISFIFKNVPENLITKKNINRNY